MGKWHFDKGSETACGIIYFGQPIKATILKRQVTCKVCLRIIKKLYFDKESGK